MPYAFGDKVKELLSINLKWSLWVNSNFVVAGIVPSFFSEIDWTHAFPILVLGNFNKIVLSSKNYLGFYTLIVGNAPSPFKSKRSL